MLDLCIDARMAFSSGIGTCIRQLVPFFNRSPFRVTLLVDQAGHLWCNGIEQITFAAPIYSMKEQAFFPFKVPACDLFWSPHYNVPLLPIKARKRVVTIHDAYHLAASRTFSLPERMYAKGVMRAAWKRSDAVITSSLFSQNELLHYLGSPKALKVIPIAANPNHFKPVFDQKAREAVRRKYQLPQKFALFVGNLKPNKNLAGLLKAFSAPILSEWSLVIAGKSKGLRNVEKVAGKRVLTIGAVSEEDLPTLYSLSDLFIFPSLYEGFGLPPLEAMCCGCPTVVSERASLPEVCGDASVYVDPTNSEQFSAAIFKALSDKDLRTQLIAKGFERVKMFSWETTALRYLELFQKVCSNA